MRIKKGEKSFKDMCNEADVKYANAIYYKNRYNISPEEAIKKASKIKKRTQEERCNEAGFLVDSVRKYSKVHNLSFDAALERLKQSPGRMASNERPKTGNINYADIKNYMENHQVSYSRARQILTGTLNKTLNQIKEEYGLSEKDIKELCKNDDISSYKVLYQMKRYCLSYEEAKQKVLNHKQSLSEKCKTDKVKYGSILYYMKTYNLDYEGAKEKILNKDKEITSIHGKCKADGISYTAVYHQMYKYGLTYEEAKKKVNELYKALYEKQLFIEKCNGLGISLYEIRMFKNYRKLGYNDDTIEAYMKHLEEKEKPSFRIICKQEGVHYNKCRQYIKNHKLSKDIEGIKIYKAYAEEKERKHNERRSGDKRSN